MKTAKPALTRVVELLQPLTVFPLFGQIDLKYHELELPVCLIPYAVDIAGRTDKGIPRPGRNIDSVDRKDCLSFEDIENFSLFFVIMQPLPGVGRDRHHLEQMTFFVKVIQGEDDPLPVILFDDFLPFAGRSVFHTGSISNPIGSVDI